MREKYKVALLGLAFVAGLALAYYENIFFFQSLSSVLTSPLAAIPVVFAHNVLAVSLILLGMTLYVRYVLVFLPEEKYGYILLQHPRLFAFIFAIMILAISVLRASTLLRIELLGGALATILLLSVPQGILEGYGIYLAIRKTLEKNVSKKGLVTVYLLFLLAATLEVCFIQILVATR